MRINQQRNAAVVMLGNVPYGAVVVFHTPPSRVPCANSFYKERACLGEPYILVDYGLGPKAFLVRASNGAVVRADFTDRVEEFDAAELTL